MSQLDRSLSVPISIYNTSDVENFGDVLYPLLIDRILHRAGYQSAEKKYAFVEGAGSLNAGYAVSAIRTLFDDAATAPRDVRLLVGGGDILRTDDVMVASHYALPVEASPATSFATLFAPPTRVSATPAQQFAERNMPPHPGAFFVSAQTCPRLAATAFVSCGVPFEIDPVYREWVCESLASATYVYVRDHLSREKLLRAGVTRPVEVAADIAIVSAEYFPKSELAASLAPTLALHGIDLARKYAVFQCSRAGQAFLPTIVRELQNYAQQSGQQIVLLPLGPCHGDVEMLQTVNALAAGQFCCLPTLSVVDMLGVIAHAHLFVGVSMHGNICARSYGVRHGFAVLPGVEKIVGAMNILDMQPSQRIDRWDTLCAYMLQLESLDPQRMQDLSALQGSASSQAFFRAVESLNGQS